MSASPLELYILTFNCGRAFVDPSSLGPHIFRALPKGAQLPDLVQFSLQEVAPIAQAFRGGVHLSPYYDQLVVSLKIGAQLRSDRAVSYKQIIVRNVGLTAIMLFGREDVVDRISWIQTAGTGVGRSEMGNKGAVGVRLGIALARGKQDTQELELSLIAAHLAPMEDAVIRRNEDWETITRRLVFSNEDDPQGNVPKRRGRAPASDADETEPLLDGDRPRGREVSPTPLFSTRGHVFVAGDLNYRTSSVPPGDNAYKAFPQPAKSANEPQHFLRLLPNDQLKKEMEAGRTFQGFAELPIEFPPTYKYDQPAPSADNDTPDPRGWIAGRELEHWTWAKHRFPSWCDRILFLPSDCLKPHLYTALPLQSTSDHRPVALSVSVEAQVPTFSGEDARKHPPSNPDPEWRQRRATARMRELIVGMAAYLALTTEGNFWVIGIVGGIAGGAYLLWKFL